MLRYMTSAKIPANAKASGRLKLTKWTIAVTTSGNINRLAVTSPLQDFFRDSVIYSQRSEWNHEYKSARQGRNQVHRIVEQEHRPISRDQLAHQIAIVERRHIFLKSIEATERQVIHPFRMRQPSGKNERKANAVIDGDLPK